MASAKANEADQHAIDAGNKAPLANQTATQANTRLTTVEQVVGNIDQYKASTQTEIRFRPGQSVLSKNAKAALDEMATPLKDQRGYIIEVQGFSSGRGQAAIATSQKMADSVVRYLVLNHEIPVYRIFVVGMGNAPVSDRRARRQGQARERWTRGNQPPEERRGAAERERYSGCEISYVSLKSPLPRQGAFYFCRQFELRRN